MAFVINTFKSRQIPNFNIIGDVCLIGTLSPTLKLIWVAFAP